MFLILVTWSSGFAQSGPPSPPQNLVAVVRTNPRLIAFGDIAEGSRITISGLSMPEDIKSSKGEYGMVYRAFIDPGGQVYVRLDTSEKNLGSIADLYKDGSEFYVQSVKRENIPENPVTHEKANKLVGLECEDKSGRAFLTLVANADKKINDFNLITAPLKVSITTLKRTDTNF